MSVRKYLFVILLTSFVVINMGYTSDGRLFPSKDEAGKAFKDLFDQGKDAFNKGKDKVGQEIDKLKPKKESCEHKRVNRQVSDQQPDPQAEPQAEPQANSQADPQEEQNKEVANKKQPTVHSEPHPLCEAQCLRNVHVCYHHYGFDFRSFNPEQLNHLNNLLKCDKVHVLCNMACYTY